MLEGIERVFNDRTAWELLRDFLDVSIVAYLIYRLLLIVRGTRAMQMGVGLGVILLLYLASKSIGLVTLQSMLQYVLSSIILIVVVVFQNDIRRALVRVGGQAWLGRGRRQEQSRVIDEVVAAVTELARHRIGAIIAFEQDANLVEFTRSEGVVIGAAVTRELLVTLFSPEAVNKLHDGAIVIRDLKIARAGVIFPMPDTKVADTSMGTRHRAAIGITEETDAVVVVVSEERGTISFCFNGNIVPNLDATSLRQTLVGLLQQKGAKKGAPAAPTKAPVTHRADVPSLLAPAPTHTAATATPITATPLPVQRTTLLPGTRHTPLPARVRVDGMRNVETSRVERARAEAARSAEPESPHARAAVPMPRTAKPMLPTTDGDEDDGPASERPLSSDRPSFVPSSRSGSDEPPVDSVVPEEP